MNSQRALQNCILRTASFLVPAPQRQEWLREWHGEVGHARETATPATSPASASVPSRMRIASVVLRRAKPRRPLRSAARPCSACSV